MGRLFMGGAMTKELQEEVARLRRLVRYLAEFAAEQGADFGLFYDAEPDQFDYPLLKDCMKDE